MMVYISHPYTGNEIENVMAAEKIAAELAREHPDVVFINPLAAMKHEGIAGLSYDVIITHCLELLSKCDALIMAGDWEKSKGCVTEYEFARGVGKRIYKLNRQI